MSEKRKYFVYFLIELFIWMTDWLLNCLDKLVGIVQHKKCHHLPCVYSRAFRSLINCIETYLIKCFSCTIPRYHSILLKKKWFAFGDLLVYFLYAVRCICFHSYRPLDWIQIKNYYFFQFIWIFIECSFSLKVKSVCIEWQTFSNIIYFAFFFWISNSRKLLL